MLWTVTGNYIFLRGKGKRKPTCVAGNEAEDDGVLDDAFSVPLFVCFPSGCSFLRFCFLCSCSLVPLPLRFCPCFCLFASLSTGFFRSSSLPVFAPPWFPSVLWLCLSPSRLCSQVSSVLPCSLFHSLCPCVFVLLCFPPSSLRFFRVFFSPILFFFLALKARECQAFVHRGGEGETWSMKRFWCLYCWNGSWGSRRWIVFETAPSSTLQWLFKICPTELMIFNNWIPIQEKSLFNFAPRLIAIEHLNFDAIYKTVFNFQFNQFGH